MRYLLRHCLTDRPTLSLNAHWQRLQLLTPSSGCQYLPERSRSHCTRWTARASAEGSDSVCPFHFIHSEAVRREDHGALPCQNCESSPLPSGWPCRATTREPKAAKPSAGGYSGWRWPQGGGVLRGVRWRDPLRDSAERPLGHGRDSLRHRSRGRHRHADRVRKAHRLRHQCDTEPFAGMSECEG